jgi:hypothetical protein
MKRRLLLALLVLVAMIQAGSLVMFSRVEQKYSIFVFNHSDMYEYAKLVYHTYGAEVTWAYVVLGEGWFMLDNESLTGENKAILSEYSEANAAFIYAIAHGQSEGPESKRFREACQALYDLLGTTIGYDLPAQKAIDGMRKNFFEPTPKPEPLQTEDNKSLRV